MKTVLKSNGYVVFVGILDPAFIEWPGDVCWTRFQFARILSQDRGVLEKITFYFSDIFDG
ncbi:MAG: hypothetical protein JNL11_00945 [Bdellovibrionaceae bacterium]|nr:hypothetical protein [Pseudobdellovibrionaceae bacterium]